MALVLGADWQAISQPSTLTNQLVRHNEIMPFMDVRVISYVVGDGVAFF